MEGGSPGGIGRLTAQGGRTPFDPPPRPRSPTVNFNQVNRSRAHAPAMPWFFCHALLWCPTPGTLHLTGVEPPEWAFLPGKGAERVVTCCFVSPGGGWHGGAVGIQMAFGRLWAVWRPIRQVNHRSPRPWAYFFVPPAAGVLPKRRSKRATRPPVSRIF